MATPTQKKIPIIFPEGGATANYVGEYGGGSTNSESKGGVNLREIKLSRQYCKIVAQRAKFEYWRGHTVAAYELSRVLPREYARSLYQAMGEPAPPTHVSETLHDIHLSAINSLEVLERLYAKKHARLTDYIQRFSAWKFLLGHPDAETLYDLQKRDLTGASFFHYIRTQLTAKTWRELTEKGRLAADGKNLRRIRSRNPGR